MKIEKIWEENQRIAPYLRKSAAEMSDCIDHKFKTDTLIYHAESLIKSAQSILINARLIYKQEREAVAKIERRYIKNFKKVHRI